MGNNKNQSDQPNRRRGRPVGKNRVPLSIEERRARNAQYERERRNEAAEAMTQLAQALNCEPNIPNGDLLATAVNKLQRANKKNPSESIEDLTRINANLESQIAKLQKQLGINDEDLDFEDDNVEYEQIETVQSDTSQSSDQEDEPVKELTRKRKRQSNNSQRGKRMKTHSETSSSSFPNSVSESTSGTRNSSPAHTSESSQDILSKGETAPTYFAETNEGIQRLSDDEIMAQFYNQMDELQFQSTHVSSTNGIYETVPQIDEASSLIVLPYLPSDTAAEEQPTLEVDQPCMDDITNDCDILPNLELTMDFLNETEKGILSEWIGYTQLPPTPTTPRVSNVL